MSKRIPKLLNYDEFLNAGYIEDITAPRGVESWSQVLGDGWENESDDKNYESYLEWHSKTFTKLGKYLYGK